MRVAFSIVRIVSQKVLFHLHNISDEILYRGKGRVLPSVEIVNLFIEKYLKFINEYL